MGGDYTNLPITEPGNIDQPPSTDQGAPTREGHGTGCFDYTSRLPLRPTGPGQPAAPRPAWQPADRITLHIAYPDAYQEPCEADALTCNFNRMKARNELVDTLVGAGVVEMTIDEINGTWRGFKEVSLRIQTIVPRWSVNRQVAAVRAVAERYQHLWDQDQVLITREDVDTIVISG